jgi:tetratricopeptide (TPR) repeat protein
MRKTVVILAAALTGLAGIWAPAQEQPADPLSQPRAAYELRSSPAKAKAAVDLFGKALKADPKSYEASWEGARACYYYGHYDLADAPDSEVLALFQEGIGRARAAVALNPKGAEGHFWLGVLDGVYGETKGIFKSLSMVPEIKQEMAAALAINPSVEGGGPDRVLGRLYFKLPGFKGGDNKKSIEHLEKSLQDAPTNALTRLYLAETYKSEGMKDKALEQVKFIIAMTPDPQWAPEHPSIKAQAQKLLDKWR